MLYDLCTSKGKEGGYITLYTIVFTKPQIPVKNKNSRSSLLKESKVVKTMKYA